MRGQILLVVQTLAIFRFSSSTLTQDEDLQGVCDSDKCKDEDPIKEGHEDWEFMDVDFDNFLTPPDLNISAIIEEMSFGDSGFVLVSGMFEPDEIEYARNRILHLIKKEPKKATHFQGAGKQELQARVWNLLNKDRIFQKFVQHPIFIEIGSKMLGDDFQLGSVATNTIFPGGSGQEPHIDYPYWDFFKRQNWPHSPKNEMVPFFMNMQATILLDDFTEENGATAVRPGTQVRAEYPWDAEEFRKNQVQATGKAGDVMLFFGLLQHCAMPNHSTRSRTGVIVQFLPKYIRPMEDLKRSVRPSVLNSVTPALRKLLLLDYPYPSILDTAVPENREGISEEDRNSEAAY